MTAILAMLALLFSSSVEAATYPLVDLHAHLFMSRGMGFLFRGNFDSPLRSKSWTDWYSSQINGPSLEASGLGLAVVTAYAAPVIAGSRRGAIRKQLRDAEEYVRLHPQWVIAKTPDAARAASLAGKRVMILAIEGASGILENERDFKEFIDDRGVRIVTFAHMMNNHLTGGALMKGFYRLNSPWEYLKSIFAPTHSADGTLINSKGVTKKGRWVAEQLIKRKVWLDFAHSPEATHQALAPLLKAAGQPLLYTHIGLRKYFKVERELSAQQLMDVAETHGVVGLVPSEGVIGKTPIPPGICPAECHERCRGNIWALAAQFNEVAAVIGGESIFLGTDFNGGTNHFPPTVGCPTWTSLDESRGFYNIGQLREVWSTLARLTPTAVPSATNGALNFINAWARLF